MKEELINKPVKLHCTYCGDVETTIKTTQRSIELFKDRPDVLFSVVCPKCGVNYALPYKRIRLT